MRRVHHNIALLAYISVIDGLLYVIIGMIIGGYAEQGYIANERYYLQYRTYVTETSLLIFAYSQLHAFSVACLTFLTVFSWPISLVFDRRQKERNLFSASLFPRIAFDGLSGLFWLVCDSWRNPSFEFFIEQPKEEYMRLLWVAGGGRRKPMSVYCGHTYFNVFVQDNPRAFIAKARTTAQGTYIRAWQRVETLFLLVLTIFLGGFVSLAVSLALSLILGLTQRFTESNLPFAMLSISFFVGWLLSIWISVRFSRVQNTDLIEFLRNPVPEKKYEVTIATGGLLERLRKRRPE